MSGKRGSANSDKKQRKASSKLSFTEGEVEESIVEEDEETELSQPSREQSEINALIYSKYAKYLIHPVNERCLVAIYHSDSELSYKEVIEGIQAALVAAYRPPDSIVTVELVPLKARNSEYYPENRWVVQMANDETASFLFRSDIYIRSRKVSAISLNQALSTEKSREFREHLKLRIAKAGAGQGIVQSGPTVTSKPGRRLTNRIIRVGDISEDPKTAVQRNEK